MKDLIRYILSVLAGVVSSLCLFLIITFPLRWVFIIVFIIWVIILLLLYYYIHRKFRDNWPDWILLVATILSFVSLTALLEWSLLRLFLVVLNGIAIVFLFVRKVPAQHQLSYLQKPVRRIALMIWVFNSFSFLTVIFALSVFFPIIPFWLLSIFAGVIIGAISFMIWRQYFIINAQKFFLWMIILSLAMIEIIWVMHLLPLGYFALGVFTTWVWYIAQLMIRFHLSNRDIVWKRQRWFLVSNAVLWVVLLLFMVRWI